ncbi:MAG TPA: GNAT family N-acetyltransferase [bacterium]|nr:GNAT family N-acetyltransferase [bacterium]HNS33746.1 GNAT family N-acetyltransferase [bacterium]HNW09327.1 GNAT family N-acetyltransferase [bacterium]HPW39753.1 GNAT family N-acetyltransferase [bacterium]
MALIIKSATIKDSPQLLNLRQTSLLEFNNFLADPDEYTPSLAAEQQIINDSRPKNNLYLVAWQDKQIIGSLLFIGGEYRKNRHGGKIEIFLRPEFRRQGVGQKLMNRLFSWAKRQGIKRIELEVWSNNRPGLAFYERLGFKPEGIRKKAYRVNNRFVNGILMSKWI